jgi:hypothetical protein
VADRVVIASVWRQATTWMTSMVRKNLRTPGRATWVMHEAFWRGEMHALRYWEEFDGTCVAIGSDMHAIRQIHAIRPDTKFCVLWREPLAQVISAIHTARRGNQAGREFGSIHRSAIEWWTGREWELKQAKELGIELTHWHFDYYTTREGFIELMKAVELPMREDVVMTPPENGSVGMRMRLEDLPGSEEKMQAILDDSFNTLELTKVAYASARRGK